MVVLLDTARWFATIYQMIIIVLLLETLHTLLNVIFYGLKKSHGITTVNYTDKNSGLAAIFIVHKIPMHTMIPNLCV